MAVLARVFGDLDIAEEAVQDAFATAVARWPESGMPPAPAGWVITTARNRAIDRLRRESSRDDRHAEAALLHTRNEPAEESPVQDDRLRLIFTCCHPMAEIHGPRAALEPIDGLSLERYHVYHAIPADLLRRLGKTNQAKAAYQAAIDRTDNAAEIAFLTRRMQALSPRRRGP